jgi:putative addiction module component (TIGR02574 family)
VIQPKDILEAALKLELTERAALAAEILGSLNESEYGNLGGAWEAEIQRRLDLFEAGRAELISSANVFEEIEAALRANRAPR